MGRAILIGPIVALAAASSPGQQHRALRVESARIGPDHRVYIRWTRQREHVQPPGDEQANVENLKIAPDRSSAGWLVGRMDLSDGSYPEDFELLVSCNGRRPNSIFPGRVIGEWQFEDGGRRIAVWDGTGHGGMFGKATLYDSRTGKLLSEWHPDGKRAPPGWAAPLHAASSSADQ